MKHAFLILLAVCLLLGLLSGCAGSIYPYGDGYSNVSTTDDGTVNGTNGRGYGYGYGYNGYTGGYRDSRTGVPQDGYSRWNGTNGDSGYGTGTDRR